MNVEILELVTGARKARGLAVIIDVFRAFSLEPYLFSRGAAEILAVGKEETARKLKAEYPDAVLIGERLGVKLPGFDYGNSPSQTEGADLAGRLVIHTTSAGTQGLVNAAGADRIITGSLVNASAVARYIRETAPDHVSLVAMGLNGKESAPEDLLCARYIRSILEAQPFDMQNELHLLRQTESGKKFFRAENQTVFPEADYHLCTRYDIFPFVLQVRRETEDIFRVRSEKVTAGSR